jgi:hypothetical protein
MKKKKLNAREFIDGISARENSNPEFAAFMRMALDAAVSAEIDAVYSGSFPCSHCTGRIDKATGLCNEGGNHAEG